MYSCCMSTETALLCTCWNYSWVLKEIKYTKPNFSQALVNSGYWICRFNGCRHWKSSRIFFMESRWKGNKSDLYCSPFFNSSVLHFYGLVTFQLTSLSRTCWVSVISVRSLQGGRNLDILTGTSINVTKDSLSCDTKWWKKRNILS